MRKALIYCRVSTEEQAEKGYSLDAQEKLCWSFAAREGLRVVETYRDEGKSGTSLNRPALQDLLAQCQQDKSIDTVIVQETDRLARNTKDHLTVKALLEKAEVRLVSVAQPMLDNSPEGNMVDTIIASVNQFQSDINSRKTRKALQEKFDAGWWPGPAPLGYLNVPAEPLSDERRSRKIVTHDKIRWPLVKEAFRLYLTGQHSVDQVNDMLYEKGLRTRAEKKLSHSVMTKLLSNPFYAGLMRWNGQRKMGRHAAMITLAEHKQVLKIMDAHNHSACRRRKHDFLLRGFVVCGICGQRYVGEKHPRKHKEYYHCGASRIFGGIFGPAAYLAGQRFGAIQISEPFAFNVGVLCVAWALGLAILMLIARILPWFEPERREPVPS